MLPAGSDNFVISDVDTTMSILDGKPGITPVNNYAALPSTLTTAQHGSIYLQLDNGSLWQWSKPGSGAGTWKKLNTVGLIALVSQGSTVTTSTTDPASAPAMINTNFTVPGGRAVLLVFEHPRISNNGSFGYSCVELWRDGVNVLDSFQSGGSSSKDVSHVLLRVVPSGTLGAPGTTVNIKATVRSTSYGGGATSAPASGTLYIIEI